MCVIVCVFAASLRKGFSFEFGEGPLEIWMRVALIGKVKMNSIRNDSCRNCLYHFL